MSSTLTLRQKIFTGAMAFVLASGMTMPAFAADKVAYMTTEDSVPITQETAFTDETVGLSWDGADTVTMSDASLYAIEIAGDATIQLEGESSVSLIYADGDLTVQGDAEAVTEEKPVLNMVGTVTPWDEDYTATGVSTNGTLTVEGVTVNVSDNTDYAYFYGDDGVTIDHTKIAPADTETEIWIENDNDGATVDIIESDLDLGTFGGIWADSTLTIDNSNVTTRYDLEELGSMRGPSNEPQLIYSSSGKIALKNMDNGEIITNSSDSAYAVSGDKDGVYLKAASKPGYYVEKQETPASEPASSGEGTGIPATGDAAGAAAGACAALAVCALAAMAISRKRTQQ